MTYQWSPEGISRPSKRLKISRLHTFTRNGVDTLERKMWPLCKKTGGHFWNNPHLVSLTQEKTLLDDYLQMEQLRFGFQYRIGISEKLDIENIEVPAMLLQPFVENAVKHGIAGNGGHGKMNVDFEKQSSDLVLKITDNGKGFDAGKIYSGLGLALSKNRISLLNAIYKDTPFDLAVNSTESGTTITVTLTQWL